MATQPRSAGGATPRRIALYVGLGVAAVAVLFAAFGLDDGTSAVALEDVAGEPTITGDPLPVLEDPASDPTVGAPAPTVTGADLDGNEVTIGEEGGELIVFLASWCPACDAELPELVAWLEDGPPAGVEVTAVTTLHDPNAPRWPPQDWLDEGGWDAPVLYDDADSSVAEAYGLSGTPYTVALRDGQVVARFSGQLGPEGLDQLAAAVAD